MCFGSKPKAAEKPAPAPEPAAPPADEQPIGSARKAEDRAAFGTAGQRLRVDRSQTAGGVGVGGSGLRM